ncbi:hypothetical protein A2U01_0061183, partial [Trifolium medium]|nr:hypothetical protein [Trifolium medium]
DISESSSSGENLQVVGKVAKQRTSKKASHCGGRSTVQHVGLPMYRKLAMTLKTAGRRRKAANTAKIASKDRRSEGRSCSGSQQPVPSELISSQRLGERPGIDLQVVLPMPPTGINHLVDD